MKKKIIIFIFFIAPLLLIAQGIVRKAKPIKITTPCNDKFVDEYPGVWLPHEYYLANVGLNKTQQQEWTDRFETFANLVKQVYPTPSGCDGWWVGGITKSFFGDRVKFSENGEVQRITKSPVIEFNFSLGLWFYYCKDKNEISTGFPDEEWSNCGLTISANALDELFASDGQLGFSIADDRWRINDRPIRLKKPVTEKWKGYDILKSEGGANGKLISQKAVLLTRPGMLPYIPVTRKQFFDIAIPYITKFYDDEISDADKLPVRSIEEQDSIKNKKIEEYKTKYASNPGMLKQYLATYTTDQQEVERKKNILLNAKNDDLKKLSDELEKTTKLGLPESPAIINIGGLIANPLPVFATEEQGGFMLVTENPNYFRKDLPATVPQFFTINWFGNEAPWRMRFRKAIEDNFPIERLQAMIDK
jgi:hypothetical protein